MNRQSIGEQIAAKLYCAETAIDRALVETANLAAHLPTARADAYLRPPRDRRRSTAWPERSAP